MGSSERIRHVVLIALRDDAPADRIRAIEEAFTALEHQVPGIVDLECGTNQIPEGLDQGFAHCLLVTFDDAAARDSYVPHPGQVDFGLSLKALLDRVLVVDHAARDDAPADRCAASDVRAARDWSRRRESNPHALAGGRF